MKLIWLFNILILTSFNGSAQENLSSAQKGNITLEIRAMFNDFHHDIIKNGLVSELNYLDSSSDFFWVPPGYSAILNYDTIKRIIISNSKTSKFIELNWETVHILPLTKNIANYSAIVKCTQLDTNNTRVHFKIIESGTLVKRKDNWKFLNGQSRKLGKN